MKNYSDHFRERTGASAGEEAIYLLTITHSQLAVPVRYCNNTADIVSNGDTYTACRFKVRLPDDADKSMPRVPIAIDNIGRELTQWLDASDGGRGAVVTISQVMPDTPDTVEQAYTLSLQGVRQDMMLVSGMLGYDNVLDLPCFPATYTPENTPGLFSQ